ncbi:MAG: baseplate J/gp47 family protein, partial [Planctomycetota bacterium]
TQTTDPKNNVLYSNLVFNNASQFKNNSKVFVSYKYYDSTRLSNITNFQTGSVAGMLARNLANQLSNLYQINNRTYEAGFLSLAKGNDLDNHADGWGLTRQNGAFATGIIKLTIGSGGTTLVVNNNYVAVSAIAGQTLGFQITSPVTGFSYETAPGTSSYYNVQAVAIGSKYNIGANTVSILYNSASFATDVTADANITVSNPILTNDGLLNTFSGGQDIETDDDLRTRIYRKANKLGRASLPAMKAALEDLDFVKNVKILDYETNPDLDADTFYVYAVGDSGLKLLTDTTSKTNLRNEINEYRPVGTQFSILSPMGIFINFSGTATLFQEDGINTTETLSAIETNITNYINDLQIGEDVIYSQLIEEAMIVPGVYKFEINKLDYTEFATNPYAFNNTDQKIIDNTTGTPTKQWYRQDFKWLPSLKTETKLYDGNTTYTMTYSDIVNSPSPYVLLSIQDSDGNYIRDPSYTTNWYTSNSDSTITINVNAGTGVGRTLATNVDYLTFYYENAGTDTIDKLRVKLSNNYSTASHSGSVELYIYSGSSSPTDLVDQATITILSGTRDYEVTLDGGSLTVDDARTGVYYAIFSGINTSSGTYISLPVSLSGTTGALNTQLYSGAGSTAITSTGKLVPNVSPLLHTIITTSGTTDIAIEKKAQTPDVAVVYDIDLSYNLISRDD